MYNTRLQYIKFNLKELKLYVSNANKTTRIKNHNAIFFVTLMRSHQIFY